MVNFGSISVSAYNVIRILIIEILLIPLFSEIARTVSWRLESYRLAKGQEIRPKNSPIQHWDHGLRHDSNRRLASWVVSSVVLGLFYGVTIAFEFGAGAGESRMETAARGVFQKLTEVDELPQLLNDDKRTGRVLSRQRAVLASVNICKKESAEEISLYRRDSDNDKCVGKGMTVGSKAFAIIGRAEPRIPGIVESPTWDSLFEGVDSFVFGENGLNNAGWATPEDELGGRSWHLDGTIPGLGVFLGTKCEFSRLVGGTHDSGFGKLKTIRTMEGCACTPGMAKENFQIPGSARSLLDYCIAWDNDVTVGFKTTAVGTKSEDTTLDKFEIMSRSDDDVITWETTEKGNMTDELLDENLVGVVHQVILTPVIAGTVSAAAVLNNLVTQQLAMGSFSSHGAETATYGATFAYETYVSAMLLGSSGATAEEEYTDVEIGEVASATSASLIIMGATLAAAAAAVVLLHTLPQQRLMAKFRGIDYDYLAGYCSTASADEEDCLRPSRAAFSCQITARGTARHLEVGSGKR